MWVRKRIDIGWGGIAHGFLRCLFPGNAAVHELRIATSLPCPEEALVCFSVRSGFDLLLAALKLPTGSEVMLSALTLGHMADIVRAHGLVPVPVDLDPATMEPDPDSLKRAIHPDTRLFVVAHLFGARCRMGWISEICRIPDAVFRRICGVLRVDADLILSRGTKAFPGADLMARFRQKPDSALLALLAHRIRGFDPREIRKRSLSARRLRDRIADSVEMPGRNASAQSHWVFPVLLREPQEAVRKLAGNGFDATIRRSMEVIDPPPGREGQNPFRTQAMVRSMAYLPAYPAMDPAETHRMARILTDHVARNR